MPTVRATPTPRPPRFPPLTTYLALATSLGLGAFVGLLCGVASALFLLLLERATAARTAHEALVYALPVAGLAVGAVYERYGVTIRGGNDLVIDTLHALATDSADTTDATAAAPPMLPARMGPMVLLGTVLTHLFGGSAGREGTAVQMGASIADVLARRLGVTPTLRLQLVAAGVAGGFGSVFGTPVAGLVFALEIVTLGQLDYAALVPALAASVVGDMTTRALGVRHTAYPTIAASPMTLLLCAKWLAFAVAVGLTSAAFVELTHFLKRVGARYLPRLPLRMAVGGIAVVALWKLVGSSDYLGLGIPLLSRAFVDPSLPSYVFAIKLVFTAVTLGAGFLGGEVTPLFVIGACLGTALARPLGIPFELAAAVGVAAVFAAASNAPLALSIMAVELFGSNVFPHVVLVSAVAYVLTGHRGIYAAQRLLRGKDGVRLSAPRALRDLSRREGAIGK